MKRINRPLIVFSIACSMVSSSTMLLASRQDDSLHTAIDGEASAVQRAEALLQLAEQRRTTQPGEGLIHARNALVFAEQAADRQRMHRALAFMREMQHRFGAYDDFLQTSIRAIELSEGLGDAKMMADDLQWLSQAYERLGDMDKSVEMSRKALFLLTTTGDSSAMGRGMLHLLNALVVAGRFNEVIEQGERALDYYSSKKDSVGEAGVWARSAEALMAQGKHADALPLLHKAETVLAVAGQQEDRFRVLADLAEVYLVLLRMDRARDFLGTAMAMVDALSLRTEKPRLLRLSSRLHEAEGDVRTALAEERAFSALEDSILDERIAERMAGLQALYQLGQKDREFEALQTRNDANETMIARERARGRWWFAAFGVILVVMIWSVWSLLNRRKAVQRIRLKNQVIRQQAEEIHAKNLELERQNMRLAESLISEEEKGVLLKEIHHRVKNNLQIVNTLLRLQGEHTNEPAYSALLAEGQGRIRAMAMVHEHIYRHGDLARIDLQEHLSALVKAVIEGYGAAERISVDVQARTGSASLDTLVPLSLLVNELLTNSVKHAFPTGSKGSVRLVLSRNDDGSSELFYNDDGIGTGDHVLYQKDSFGMSLMRAFAEQLDGEMRILKGEGTTVILTFRPEAVRIRKAS